MIRMTLTAAVAALLAVGLSAPADSATVTTPCKYEDASGPQAFPCIWTGGPNGTGETFTAYRASKDLCPVTYGANGSTSRVLVYARAAGESTSRRVLECER